MSWDSLALPIIAKLCTPIQEGRTGFLVILVGSYHCNYYLFCPVLIISSPLPRRTVKHRWHVHSFTFCAKVGV